MESIEEDILTLEQACEFLRVSEKTLIKLLREEHIPARKIGREWRFSKDALIKWISKGDSFDYVNFEENYQVSRDVSGNNEELINTICNEVLKLKSNSSIKNLINDIKSDLSIPDQVKLRISYKQKRDTEKLEFKLFWPLRDEAKIK